MEMTRDDVEFKTRRPEGGRSRMSAVAKVDAIPRLTTRGRVTQASRRSLGVDEARLAALDALVAARRRRADDRPAAALRRA